MSMYIPACQSKTFIFFFTSKVKKQRFFLNCMYLLQRQRNKKKNSQENPQVSGASEKYVFRP